MEAIVNVEEDEQLVQSELLSLKAMKEEFPKQTDSKIDGHVSNSENEMCSEDLSEVELKTEQDPELTIENHVDDASNLILQTGAEHASVRSKDYEQQNNMNDTDTGEDRSNESVERQQDDENNMADFSTGKDMSYDVVQVYQQHEKELEELRVTLQDEYQKQVLRISDELRDHYQNDLDEKITKLEEDWEIEFTKQKKEFDEQVSTVQREQWAQCQEAIERVTLDAEDQLKNMTCSYERETAEHKQRIKELLEREAMWEMKEKELANENCEKENESLSKIKKLENQLSFEREEVETQLNDAKHEIKTLKKQHQNEMENLTTELEKKYSDIVDEMRKELKSKYQDEMDRKVNQVESHLREQYEQDLEKTQEEVHESTSTLKAKYEKQVTEIVAQLEELHERNQQHEVREAKLKESFESERRKVIELKKQMEGKIQVIQKLEGKSVTINNEFEKLENRLKRSLEEKFALEKKVNEVSESESKELIELREDLARKSERIHELERYKNDSKSHEEFEELQEKLQEIAKKKDSLEQKLNENIKCERLNAGLLRKELALKDEEVKRTREKEADVKNCKEYKELEEKVRSIFQEKLLMEQALEQNMETNNKKIEDLQQKLEIKDKEILELNNKINDGKKNDEYGALQETTKQLTLEKKALEQQLEEQVSEINLLEEKIKEGENVASDFKSKYEKKILQLTQSYEEEVKVLEDELKLKKECENEAAELKKDVCRLQEEISKLKEELETHKFVISELEETSQARELEIANMILNSPTAHSFTDSEFDFSEESSDRTQQLKNELAKYKKKVQELEEEAEDKFETTLCPNCTDPEKGEEILLQTETLVDKIERECEKKVQRLTKDLEKMDKSLCKKIKECDELKEKLAKTEEDLHDERKRSLEFSKLRRNLDVNANVLEYEETSEDKQRTSEEGGERYGDALREVMNESNEQIQALKSLQSQMKDEKTQKEDNQLKSLFEEQEKFYKTEILRKDNEISELMNDNEKIQHQVETFKEKLAKGEAQCKELRGRTLEQKAKYENEINLMQSEIKMVIQENSEVKDQLEICKNNRKKIENLQTKLQETENEFTEMSRKYELEVMTLKQIIQEKENCILDLRNALEVLENSKKETQLSISSQEQDFADRERKLLDEIRGKITTFEKEKAAMIEERFLEKEEMKKTIANLEMLLDEQRIKEEENKQWEFKGYGEIDGDTTLMTRSACDKLGAIKGYGEVEWIANGSQEAESVAAQYEEINYSPVEESEHGEMSEPSSLLMRYNGLPSNDSLFSDGNYEEIGCYDVEEKHSELLKYEHDIDLVLERKENERLRSEIETLSKCVDVFHDECESLKKSLDKTVDLVGMLRNERDNLKREHYLNMTEHSELMLDIVKYEETINRLERGNEQLENDRKFLEECLQQKQGVLSDLRTDVKFSIKHNSNVHELKDSDLRGKGNCYQTSDTEYRRKNKLASDEEIFENIVKDVEFGSSSVPGVEHEAVNEPFLRKLGDNEQPLSDDTAVLMSNINSADDESDQEQDHGARKSVARGSVFKVADYENSYVQSRSAINHRKRSNGKSHFRSQHLNEEENDTFLKCRSEIQVSSKDSRSELTQGRRKREMTSLQKNVTSRQQLKNSMGKTNSTQTPAGKDRSNRGQNKNGAKHTSTSKNGSIYQPPGKVSSDSRGNTTSSSILHKHTIRNDNRITNLKLSSKNFTPKVKELSGTPVSMSSTNSMDSSKLSSLNVLTSTGVNSTRTHDRLVPNLSGLSPIVSPLDRLYHTQKQKWQRGDVERWNISRGYHNYDNTTFLIDVDPNGFLLSPRTPKMDRSHCRPLLPHNRSRSADDRLLTSSKNISGDFLEKPLIINFQDFVFRHRVKSSEDVANLRDPSPAELWFS